MKRSLFIIILSCVSSLCLAQGRVGYTYDACGNRVARTVILNSKESRSAISKTDTDIPMSDTFQQHKVTLRPVSSDGTVIIEVDGLTPDDRCSVSAYTADGRLVGKSSVTSTTTSINLGSHPAGYYILWLELNGERQSWKIIKK